MCLDSLVVRPVVMIDIILLSIIIHTLSKGKITTVLGRLQNTVDARSIRNYYLLERFTCFIKRLSYLCRADSLTGISNPIEGLQVLRQLNIK